MVKDRFEDFCAEVLDAMHDRVATIKAAGGISMLEVVTTGGNFCPPGYWYDPLSCYFVPIGTVLLGDEAAAHYKTQLLH